MPPSTDTSGGADSASGQVVAPDFAVIAEHLQRVNDLIARQLHDCSRPVRRLAEYLSSNRGKMVRPALVLLSGKACGGITDDHIRVAAVFELIHNATLLHDDVLDNGRSRRGLPTVNALRGNESAVLLGDFVLSKVFKLCVALKPQVSGIIAAAATRTCEGELCQVLQRENLELTESQYLEIITEKSAALFSSACSLGASLAGADETMVQSLGSYGLNTGIAFQITDDLLDVTGDESETGKTLGADVENQKLTLPLIHLLAAVDDERKRDLADLLLAGAVNEATERSTGSAGAILLEQLRDHGSLDYSRRLAQGFVEKALDALSNLKESEAKNTLIETVRFVTSRVR